MDHSAKILLFNGAIVLLVGLLCGFPYGVAIRRNDEELIRAWKLAHLSLSLGGVAMIAIAACLTGLGGSDALKQTVLFSFIVSGYGFCFALVGEPFLGARGLSWSGNIKNKIVYVGNIIGAFSSLIGTLALIAATYLSM